jgi:hypothetical protein
MPRVKQELRMSVSSTPIKLPKIQAFVSFNGHTIVISQENTNKTMLQISYTGNTFKTRQQVTLLKPDRKS